MRTKFYAHFGICHIYMGDFTQPQQNSDDGGKNHDIGAIKGSSLTNSYIYALLDFEYSSL